MTKHIQYHRGDATVLDEQEGGNEKFFIIHCCNNIGAWGAGFVVPLGLMYPAARKSYLSLESYNLGSVDFVDCGEAVVCNMIGQNGVRSPYNPSPVDYKAIRNCLKTVAAKIREHKLDNPSLRYIVQGPKFGSGLAGGKWNLIEDIIAETILQEADEVRIYEL